MVAVLGLSLIHEQVEARASRLETKPHASRGEKELVLRQVGIPAELRCIDSAERIQRRLSDPYFLHHDLPPGFEKIIF
jgi:hypothetical protein